MAQRSRPATAAALRRRWTDPQQAGTLFDHVQRFLRREALGHPLDLRGAELGMGGPLSDFRLGSGTWAQIDLSYGKGTLVVRNATVEGVIAHRFAFDRASYFSRSVFSDCSFAHAHLHLTAEDVEFVRCDFQASTFAGGFNEYGFRRCTFRVCSFAQVAWRNTYLRACEFHDCSFLEGNIRTSILAGVKVFGNMVPPTFFEGSHLISLYFNGEPLDVGGGAA